VALLAVIVLPLICAALGLAVRDPHDRRLLFVTAQLVERSAAKDPVKP